MMMTAPVSRRRLLAAAGATLALGSVASLPLTGTARAAAPLAWTVLPGAATSFFKASVLLTGATEAVLIDGAFTRSEGRAQVAAIKASGKRLTTVFVSHGDPDYYFGLEEIRAAFPEARIVATAETVAHIQRTVEKKREFWGPKIGADAPTTIVLPTALTAPVLELDGERLEIVTPEPGLPGRAFVWAPSVNGVFGGVLLFAGLHVWTADTAQPEQRRAWLRALDAVAARKPSVVVAAHMAPGSPTDGAAILHTRDYLRAFEEELVKAADGAALIAAMKGRYPTAGLEIALDIGAKVAKGEMRWG